jgi:hypothetical protein
MAHGGSLPSNCGFFVLRQSTATIKRHVRFPYERTRSGCVGRNAASGRREDYGIVGDTLNRIAHAIDRSEIDWVHMRHEEAGALRQQPKPC